MGKSKEQEGEEEAGNSYRVQVDDSCVAFDSSRARSGWLPM
jgi:hypothetical protein